MPLPVVTGISPKEGPPGTKITIRGENLGGNPKDLIAVRICQVDCLLSAEWISANKIVARTGPCKGKGDIIVATISGGVGTSTVQFRGVSETIDPLHESAVWVDESKLVPPVGYPKNQAHSKIETTTNLDDPLGLLKDPDKIKKYPTEDLQELYPDNSGNVIQENFLPIWFLLENHHSNSFRELKTGLESLKRTMNQKTEGPYSFIKTNLITFLGCLDALESLDERMEDDIKSVPGTRHANQLVPLNQLIRKLELEINQANEKGKWLFEDIFGNKAKADSTRNALALINRFRLLFNLPRSLSKLISKGDYSMAINDYNRAKSLYFYNNQGLGDIPALKKVFELSETRMAGLKNTLRGKLFDYPSTLEEQKQILKYLYDLDPKSDSCMESITKMASWLTLLLNDCKDRHSKKKYTKSRVLKTTTNVETTITKNYPLIPIRSDMYFDSSHNKSVVGVTAYDLLPDTKTLEGEASGTNSLTTLNDDLAYRPIPPFVHFVEELCGIMTHGFRDFWTLGQAYFSGHLYFINREAPDKAFKIDPNKFSTFKRLAFKLCTLYCGILRALFLPLTLNSYPYTLTNGATDDEDRRTLPADPEMTEVKLRSTYGDWSNAFKMDSEFCCWLIPVIARIRHCQLSLLQKGEHTTREDISGSVSQLPQESATIVKSTVCGLRVYALLTILKVTEKEVRRLCLKENWKLLKHENGYGCTKLVNCFNELFESKLRYLQVIIKPASSATHQDLLEFPVFGINRTAQKDVTYACTRVLLALGEALQYLAFGTVKKKRRESISPTRSSPSPSLSSLTGGKDRFPPLTTTATTGKPAEIENEDDTYILTTLHLSKIKTDKRLLYCLSNLEYILNNYLKRGRLVEALIKSGISQTENIRKKVTHAFQELSELLFQAYCQRISKPIVEAIQPNINSMCFDWRDCPEPTDVKSYARIIVQNCVEVFSELNLVSPALTTCVMSKLVENIFDKLFDIYSKITFTNDKSLLQAKLDVSCLECVLGSYLTSESKDSLDKIYALFSKLADSPMYSDHKRKLMILQDSFKKRNYMNMECLKSNHICNDTFVNHDIIQL